jgi:group I intron endonuclease
MHGVYCIYNTETDKYYVGSSSSKLGLSYRLHRHMQDLIANKHHSNKLQRSWNKHGPTVFVFKIIEICDEFICISREQFWMDHLNSVNNGYNIAPQAGSNRGIKLSPEHIEKVAQANRGRPMPEHVRDAIKNATLGRKDTPEQSQRKSAAHKGRKITWGDKISETRKGKPLSDEHRAALAEAAKTRKKMVCEEVESGRQWNNVKLAAEFYGVHDRTLLKYIKKGKPYKNAPLMRIVGT